MKLHDPQLLKLIESYTGLVRKFRPGPARAQDEPEIGEKAEFKCFGCGLVGRIGFHQLRRKKPITLRCRRCKRRLS